MPVLVGGSIRKSLGREMLDASSRWPVCEVVPENWDPDDGADVEVLEFLNRSTKILLHSLSLNVLGPARPDFVLHRIKAWSKALDIGMVTDHFCWSASDAHSLGVFIPPLDDLEVLKLKIRTLKQAVGMKIGLENISLSAAEPDFCLRYHQSFARACHDEGMSILLDLENLRLDSVSSGIPAWRLLSLYDEAEICGYHVAGSTAGELILDTHDQPVPKETLHLLSGCYRARPRPVIYERDYALGVTELTAEVNRIAAYLEREVGAARQQGRQP